MATEVRDMAYISDEILLAGILIERRVWMSAGCDDKQYV